MRRPIMSKRKYRAFWCVPVVGQLGALLMILITPVLYVASWIIDREPPARDDVVQYVQEGWTVLVGKRRP